MKSILSKLHKSIGIIDEPSSSAMSNWNKSVEYYNRFKLPTVNDALQKGFAHIFFVRPDCNILTGGDTLTDNLKNNQTFSIAMKKSPLLVKELVYGNGSNHDFMLSLSNKVGSFSPSDEYINTDTYGKTYTGYKIAYGKSNIDSKTAGNFSITYTDDRYLHVYELHKLWVEYISGVYRGEIIPKSANVINKILDYAGACYYILTAEDNETIIFWSKYYGVFPTIIPSEPFAWTKGSLIQNPELTIQYMYSFKEDYNPMSMVEFNRNSRIYSSSSQLTYLPTFDSTLGHVGNTWVGAPFIELVTNNSDAGCPYTYKLRFKPKT